MILRHDLKIGTLVIHYPAGEKRLRELHNRGIIPTLNPSFRIGIIVDKKPGHWLVYCGDNCNPAWYVSDELRRLS